MTHARIELTDNQAVPAAADAKFEAFIQNKLWPRCKAAGISRKLFDAAFEGITEPDPQVLKLAKNQPEFTSTTSAYLEKAVTQIRIDTGKQHLADDAALLESGGTASHRRREAAGRRCAARAPAGCRP